MVFLVTQFPKPAITEHWEDLPPARLKEAVPAAKGLRDGLSARWGQGGCSRQGGVGTDVGGPSNAHT